MTREFTSPAAPSRSTAKTCAYPAPTSAGKRTEPAPPVKPHARQNSRHLVILTGLSGSGKSTVLHAFEDMGFYCVDNLPVELMPIFAELHAAGEGALLRRYSETRRPHPLGKNYSVRESLSHERALMDPIRKLADVVIDTTQFNVHELRHFITARFKNPDR